MNKHKGGGWPDPPLRIKSLFHLWVLVDALMVTDWEVQPWSHLEHSVCGYVGGMSTLSVRQRPNWVKSLYRHTAFFFTTFLALAEYILLLPIFFFWSTLVAAQPLSFNLGKCSSYRELYHLNTSHLQQTILTYVSGGSILSLRLILNLNIYSFSMSIQYLLYSVYKIKAASIPSPKTFLRTCDNFACFGYF